MSNENITYDSKSESSDATAVSLARIPSTRSSGKRILKKTKSATSTSSTKKKRKNVCYMDSCSNASLKFIGDCNFCQGHYCSKHRIMENHNCTGLKSCREQMHKRNADKLSKEQTIIPKIQI